MNFLKKTLSKTGSMVKSVTDSSPTHRSQQTFLHGYLLIEIRGARDLPNMEGWLSTLVDNKDVTDPFVDVVLGRAKLAKTSVINNSLNPDWNESYRIEVCHFGEELIFEVRDKDHAYAEYIGAVAIDTKTILHGEIKEGWFPILKKNKTTQRGTLHIRVEFISQARIERTYEVDCYFPMHGGNLVTLYQDAHCQPNMPQFASMKRPDGLPHSPRSCWMDLYNSIMEAEKLICVTGWAVWTGLLLFRGNDRAIDQRNLGEILLDKANRGVKVYVMVWSEKTSGDILGEKGIMGTHDMETFNYFKKTRVNCALCPREMEKSEFTDYLQNEFSTGAYTHHQKSVICDAPSAAFPGGQRRLIAFVGGLDLTGGRYDTPDHELYSTLLNEHNGDFRNSNAKSVPPEQGPREPWHDIHSKVEGPVAQDVFMNFYERWQKQGTKYGTLDLLDRSEINPDIIPDVDPSRLWNVQLFRSITDDSAVFNKDLAQQLNSKKGRMVDASIAQAYIQTIRNAENFIYVENQYFLGSAYCWLQNDDTNCHHTIPSEITQKIVDKIYKNQRFCAYIVIPMFPEGDPASAPIQEILYWQTRTIEMMYSRVGAALLHTGNNTHPTDWLLFLCPGKRELAGEHLDRLEAATEPMAKTFRDSLRFPIYVHSKMMIVDDAYIIVGSANINQRSMAGTRDTEMAVGCWQPHFQGNNVFGDVHTFRMSLWTEHLRIWDEVFLYPARMECVAKVKELCLYNWQQYNAAPLQPVQTPGQLLPYPMNVLPDGRIENLEGVRTFPDFGPGAKVFGKLSAMIPQKVTT